MDLAAEADAPAVHAALCGAAAEPMEELPGWYRAVWGNRRGEEDASARECWFGQGFAFVLKMIKTSI